MFLLALLNNRIIFFCMLHLKSFSLGVKSIVVVKHSPKSKEKMMPGQRPFMKQ